MRFWKDTLISPSTSIMNALRIIDIGALKIALVVNEKYQLIGTVTDGDIRRGILRGISLESPVSTIMKSDPITANVNDSRETILSIMKSKAIHHIPVVDEQGRIVNVELIEELVVKNSYPNAVVLMAGGLGTRLSPLTDDTPKPLLKVGTKPILETILESFIEHGFYNFYLSVNYKADMIMDYFGNGEKWGVHIQYIHESKRLGTAGALSLINDFPSEPLIVMNGDLLTKVNYSHLIDFHTDNDSAATMCVREYEFQVPYGVVKVDDHRLVSIEEKPVQRFFVSGGIYVLNPRVIELIPSDTFYDMPTLFEKLIDNQEETSVFPIREYWIDIGRMDDFHRANEEYIEAIV